MNSSIENVDFRTIDTQDPKFLEQTKEAMLNDMKKLEKDFQMMKNVIIILDVQIQSKDTELQKSRVEISALRSKVSALALANNRAKHTSQIEFMNIKPTNTCKIIKKSKDNADKNSITQADMRAFIVSMAGALENCISSINN